MSSRQRPMWSAAACRRYASRRNVATAWTAYGFAGAASGTPLPRAAAPKAGASSGTPQGPSALFRRDVWCITAGPTPVEATLLVLCHVLAEMRGAAALDLDQPSERTDGNAGRDIFPGGD
jgi:hypothetical protein